MRWLVTGAKGMLGQDLVTRILRGGHDLIAADIADVDITDPHSVAEIVRDVDIVANVAAFTNVDGSETQERLAFEVNSTGAEILARRCKEIGARLVHISTDYVFSGDAVTPYREDALMEPKGAYGRTKAAGEWAIRANTDNYLIIRTAWLYGASGRCFPRAILNKATEGKKFQVVTDEIGQPTWTVDLADLLVKLVEAEVPSGIYHGTSSGRTNWADFARVILESAGYDPALVEETTAAAYNLPAPRPHFSCLAHDRLGVVHIDPIGDWKERWNRACEILIPAFNESL